MTMIKTFKVLLLLLGLTWLQLLAHAQTSTGTESAFQNTPGLMVPSPRNGDSIPKDTTLIFAAQISGRRIGTAHISVAKTDGSSNTTIADIKQGSMIRLLQPWTVVSTKYPTGDYHVQMIVTASSATSVPTTNTTAPIALPTSGSVTYYWKALIHVTDDQPNSAANVLHGMSDMHVGAKAALFKMAVALGVLAVAFVITL